VLLKELLDNSIDAAEDAGIPPAVQVTVDGQALTVTDNGPGIPPEPPAAR
jgi:DNA topoisomerase VI subunit B